MGELAGEGLRLWLLGLGCWHFNGTSMALQQHFNRTSMEFQRHFNNTAMWQIFNISKYYYESVNVHKGGGGGKTVFLNPSLTGAVLQTHCNLLIYSFTNSRSKSKSLKHHYSKTGKARELKFWENVYPPTNVTCCVSCVMCNESWVICHLIFFYLCKVG